MLEIPPQVEASIPAEFKARVRRELAAADARARLSAPETRLSAPGAVGASRRRRPAADGLLPSPPAAKPPKAPRRARRRREGSCRGCGCPYDTDTPGCGNCRARHSMRGLYAARRRTPTPA